MSWKNISEMFGRPKNSSSYPRNMTNRKWIADNLVPPFSPSSLWFLIWPVFKADCCLPTLYLSAASFHHQCISDFSDSDAEAQRHRLLRWGAFYFKESNAWVNSLWSMSASQWVGVTARSLQSTVHGCSIKAAGRHLTWTRWEDNQLPVRVSFAWPTSKYCHTRETLANLARWRTCEDWYNFISQSRTNFNLLGFYFLVKPDVIKMGVSFAYCKSYW